MRIVITAGEASGDLFGAELARALRDLDPNIVVSGIGGPRMRRAGVTLVRDSSTWGSIGVVNALKVLHRALAGYAALRRHLRAHPPAVLVPIDFGAFNVRVGRFARSLGIPVYYFIVPGSWRRSGPISPSLLEAADYFCTQLPWHADRLRAAGARAEFYGHPLLDLAFPSRPAEAIRQAWGLEVDAPVVCLFPGSRRHEVEHILPAFLDAAALIRERVPRARFVLGLAEVVDRRQVGRILRTRGWSAREPAEDQGGPGRGAFPFAASSPGSHTPEVIMVTGRTYDCLAVANAALCASGTVTLESAILGVPHLIVYRGSFGMRLQYQLVKHKIGYIGLPNLLLDASICPELLDTAATPERIADECTALLLDEERARAQKDGFARLMELLGQPGVIRRAAERILDVARRTQA
ncbi:MAG: hypothetical protein GX785_14365 [Armatimonadetes bacterium]|nr:hypothetical protein [Armatimonadota bacterium]HOQ28253.1 hypothetical protein [Armatimonadota bacterium]